MRPSAGNSAFLEDLLRLVRTARTRLLGGLSWSAVSALALQGSVLLSTVILARILGAAEFGGYAILLATATTLTGIAQGGTGITATKFVAEWLHADRARIGRLLRACRVVTIAAGAVAAALLLLLAEFLAEVVLGQPQLAGGLRWIALAIVFQVGVAFQYGALVGLGEFSTVGRASTISGLLYIAFTVGGAFAAGFDGAVAGYVLASAARSTVFTVSLRRALSGHGIPRATLVGAEEWRSIYAFALPATLASYVTMPCLWAVTALVARQPDGLQWAALFAVGHQLRMTVLQLPALLNSVAFSAFGRLRGQGNTAAVRDVLWSALAFGLGLTTALALAVALGASELLRLYGPEFPAARTLLVVLLLSTVPEFVAGLAGQLVQVAGRMWTSLWFVVLPRDLSYLLLAGAFVASHGLLAAGLAYSAAQLLGMMLTIALAARAWIDVSRLDQENT